MSKKALTLMELTVSLVLVGIMVVAVSSVMTAFALIRRDIVDKGNVKAYVATETIFQRLMRSNTMTSAEGEKPAYEIDTDAKAVTYRIGTRQERIWLNGTALQYNNGTEEIVLLRDVINMRFQKDFSNRLVIEMTLQGGQVFRTSVQPRNEYTARTAVN